MILKCTLKNCCISVSDVFFPQLSNDVGSFSVTFHFHLQKVQNVLYLKKCIFNIFFYPLDRMLSIFYVGKDIFQKVPKMFSARNRMRERVFECENGKFRKNCLHHWKAKEKIHRKRLFVPRPLSRGKSDYFIVYYNCEGFN